MDAIYPLADTYLTLLPTELRKLLYFYVNTTGMTYKIFHGSKHTTIHLSLPPNFSIIMVLDNEYMKQYNVISQDMLPFIELHKYKMTFHIPPGMATLVSGLELNDVTTLFETFGSNMELQTYLNDTHDYRTNLFLIPFCIEVIEALEQVHNVLSKE